MPVPPSAAAEIVLDLRGLKCPLPALRTERALAHAAPGTILKVQATDPMAAIDIPHLLAQTGDRLLGQQRDGERLTFRIEKTAPA